MIKEFLKSETPCEFCPLFAFMFLHPPLEIGGIPDIIFAVGGEKDIDKVARHRIIPD